MAGNSTDFGDRRLRVSDLDTIRGAAKTLGISYMFITMWVQMGMIPSARIGSAVVVCLEDIRTLREKAIA